MGGALIALAFALGSPGLASAQIAPGQAPSQEEGATQQEMQSWFAELQQIHGQLESIQIRALQDPQISAAQEDLGVAIREAMEAADPTIEQQLARVETLENEASEANEAGNRERLEQLAAEAQAIQQHFMGLQEQVLVQPEFAGKLADFQTRLEEKMVEIDPIASTLINRFRELESKLAAAMGGA